MVNDATVNTFGPATKNTNGTSTPSLTVFNVNTNYHLNLNNATFFTANTESTIAVTFP